MGGVGLTASTAGGNQAHIGDHIKGGPGYWYYDPQLETAQAAPVGEAAPVKPTVAIYTYALRQDLERI